MPLALIAYFFGGVFAANSIPHLVSGVLGTELQTPFASPPFKGLSSPAVNVAWGSFNLALSYVLVLQVADFDPRRWLHTAVCFAGFTAMAFQCARGFKRLREPSR